MTPQFAFQLQAENLQKLRELLTKFEGLKLTPLRRDELSYYAQRVIAYGV